MEKISIDETLLKFIYFDEEQKLKSCWVLLVHVEVGNSLKGYFKGTLWYKSCWVLLVHVEVGNSLKGYFKGTLWYKFMF